MTPACKALSEKGLLIAAPISTPGIDIGPGSISGVGIAIYDHLTMVAICIERNYYRGVIRLIAVKIFNGQINRHGAGERGYVGGRGFQKLCLIYILWIAQI